MPTGRFVIVICLLLLGTAIATSQQQDTAPIKLTSVTSYFWADGSRVVLWRPNSLTECRLYIDRHGSPVVAVRRGPDLGAALYVDATGEGCLLLRARDGRAVRIRASALLAEAGIRRYEQIPVRLTTQEPRPLFGQTVPPDPVDLP